MKSYRRTYFGKLLPVALVLLAILAAAGLWPLRMPSPAGAQDEAPPPGLDVVFLLDNDPRMAEDLTDPGRLRYDAIAFAADLLATDAFYHNPGAQHRVGLITYAAEANVRLDLGSETARLGPYNREDDPAHTDPALRDQREADVAAFGSLRNIDEAIYFEEGFSNAGFAQAIGLAQSMLASSAAPNREQMVFVISAGKPIPTGGINFGDFVGDRMRQFNSFMNGRSLHVIMLPVDGAMHPGHQGDLSHWSRARSSSTPGGEFLRSAELMGEVIEEQLFPALGTVVGAREEALHRVTVSSGEVLNLPPFVASAAVVSVGEPVTVGRPDGSESPVYNRMSDTTDLLILEDPLPGEYRLDGAAEVQVILKMATGTLAERDPVPQWTTVDLDFEVTNSFGQVITYPPPREFPVVELTFTHTGRQEAGWVIPLEPTGLAGHQQGQFIPPYDGFYRVQATVVHLEEISPFALAQDLPTFNATPLTLKLAPNQSLHARQFIAHGMRFELDGLDERALADGLTHVFTVGHPDALAESPLTLQAIAGSEDRYQTTLTFLHDADEIAPFELDVAGAVTIPGQPDTRGRTTFAQSAARLPEIEMTVSRPQVVVAVDDASPVMLVQPALRVTDRGGTLPDPDTLNDLAALCVDIQHENQPDAGTARSLRLTADDSGDYRLGVDAFIPEQAGIYRAEVSARADCSVPAAEAYVRWPAMSFEVYEVFLGFVDPEDPGQVYAPELRQFFPADLTLGFFFEQDGVVRRFRGSFDTVPRLSPELELDADETVRATLQRERDDQYRLALTAPRRHVAVILNMTATAGERKLEFWPNEGLVSGQQFMLPVSQPVVDITVEDAAAVALIQPDLRVTPGEDSLPSPSALAAQAALCLDLHLTEKPEVGTSLPLPLHFDEEAGNYRLAAKAYVPQEAGEYTITVTARSRCDAVTGDPYMLWPAETFNVYDVYMAVVDPEDPTRRITPRLRQFLPSELVLGFFYEQAGLVQPVTGPFDLEPTPTAGLTAPASDETAAVHDVDRRGQQYQVSITPPRRNDTVTLRVDMPVGDRTIDFWSAIPAQRSPEIRLPVDQPRIAVNPLDAWPLALIQPAIDVVPLAGTLPEPGGLAELTMLCAAFSYLDGPAATVGPLPLVAATDDDETIYRLNVGAFVPQQAGRYQLTVSARAACDDAETAPYKVWAPTDLEIHDVYLGFVDSTGAGPVDPLLTQFLRKDLTLGFFYADADGEPQRLAHGFSVPVDVSVIVAGAPVEQFGQPQVEPQSGNRYTFTLPAPRTHQDVLVQVLATSSARALHFWSEDLQATRDTTTLHIDPVTLTLDITPVGGGARGKQFGEAVATVRVSSAADGRSFDGTDFARLGGRIMARLARSAGDASWDFLLEPQREGDDTVFTATVPLPAGGGYTLDVSLLLDDTEVRTTRNRAEAAPLEVDTLRLAFPTGANPAVAKVRSQQSFSVVWLDAAGAPVTSSFTHEPSLSYTIRDQSGNQVESDRLRRDPNTGAYDFGWEVPYEGEFALSVAWTVTGPDGQRWTSPVAADWNLSVPDVIRVALTLDGEPVQHYYKDYSFGVFPNDVRTNPELMFLVAFRYFAEGTAGGPAGEAGPIHAYQDVLPDLDAATLPDAFTVTVIDDSAQTLDPDRDYRATIEPAEDLPGVVRLRLGGLDESRDYVVRVDVAEPYRAGISDDYLSLRWSTPATTAQLQKHYRSLFYPLATLLTSLLISAVIRIGLSVERWRRHRREPRMTGWLRLVTEGQIRWQVNLKNYGRNTRRLSPVPAWNSAQIMRIIAWRPEIAKGEPEAVACEIWQSLGPNLLIRAIHQVLYELPVIRPWRSPNLVRLTLDGPAVPVLAGSNWQLVLSSTKQEEEGAAPPAPLPDAGRRITVSPFASDARAERAVEEVVDEVVSEEDVAEEEEIVEEVISDEDMADVDEIVSDEVIAEEEAIVEEEEIVDEVISDEVISDEAISEEIVPDEDVSDEDVPGVDEDISGEVIAEEEAIVEEVIPDEDMADVDEDMPDEVDQEDDDDDTRDE